MSIVTNRVEMNAKIDELLWCKKLPEEYRFAKQAMRRAATMSYALSHGDESDYMRSISGSYNPPKTLVQTLLSSLTQTHSNNPPDRAYKGGNINGDGIWFSYGEDMYYFIARKNGRARVYLPEDDAGFRARINWLSAKLGIKMYLFRDKGRHTPGNVTYGVWINDGTFFVEAFSKNDCITASR